MIQHKHFFLLISISQLKKFYRTVKNNARLGEKVKDFFVAFMLNDIDVLLNPKKDDELEDIVYDLLQTCLPNLEAYLNLRLDAYAPLLDALANSRLPRLKRIDEPENGMSEREGVGEYVVCALLMKDRLENIVIADNFRFPDERNSDKYFFNRLYSQIHHFKKLTSINITRTTNKVIDMLEHITQSCEHLNSIIFDLEPKARDKPVNTDISVDMISTFTPRAHVQYLYNRAQAI